MPFAINATLATLVVLGIMVLVHEFGHFITAKFFGVRVEVFSIGFGKRLFGFKRGDTDYRISLLPLGGYVKMSGEMAGDGTPATGDNTVREPGDPGDFANHPRWQRILIGLSGPCANFILAFLLMTGLYMMHNEVPRFYSQPAVVDHVVANSPAAKAGIQAGDKIVQFDAEQNPTWEQIGNRAALDVNSTVPIAVERNGQVIQANLAVQNPGDGDDFESKALGVLPRVNGGPLAVSAVEPGTPAEKAGLKAGDVIASVDGHEFTFVGSMLAYLQETGGRPVNLTIQRAGGQADSQTLQLNVTPMLADDGTGHSAYRLGFLPKPFPYNVEQLSLPEAARRSVKTNLQYSGYIVEVLRKLFTRKTAVQNLSGPIGIARETGEAISMPGWQPIIGLMAMISLNLGIFNLLPIPILDGGMILFLLIEGVLRRDLNQEFKERVYQVAFVVLILFAAFVMFNDVTKLPIFSKLKP